VLCAYQASDASMVMGLVSSIVPGVRATRAKIRARVGSLAQLGILWVENSLSLGRAPELSSVRSLDIGDSLRRGPYADH
jgi:hypothetical protein